MGAAPAGPAVPAPAMVAGGEFAFSFAQVTALMEAGVGVGGARNPTGQDLLSARRPPHFFREVRTKGFANFVTYAQSRAPSADGSSSGRLSQPRHYQEFLRLCTILDTCVTETLEEGGTRDGLADKKSTENIVRVLLGLGLMDSDFHGSGLVASEAILGQFSNNVQPIEPGVLALMSTLCRNAQQQQRGKADKKK